jgi:hypothetical protein
MLDLKIVQEYLSNRKFKTVKVTNNGKLVFVMSDNRKLIISKTEDGFSFRIKRDGKYMSKRDLDDYNYQIKKIVKNFKANLPVECRNCFDPRDDI